MQLRLMLRRYMIAISLKFPPYTVQRREGGRGRGKRESERERGGGEEIGREREPEGERERERYLDWKPVQ